MDWAAAFTHPKEWVWRREGGRTSLADSDSPSARTMAALRSCSAFITTNLDRSASCWAVSTTEQGKEQNPGNTGKYVLLRILPCAVGHGAKLQGATTHCQEHMSKSTQSQCENRAANTSSRLGTGIQRVAQHSSTHQLVSAPPPSRIPHRRKGGSAHDSNGQKVDGTRPSVSAQIHHKEPRAKVTGAREKAKGDRAQVHPI